MLKRMMGMILGHLHPKEYPKNKVMPFDLDSVKTSKVQFLSIGKKILRLKLLSSDWSEMLRY